MHSGPRTGIVARVEGGLCRPFRAPGGGGGRSPRPSLSASASLRQTRFNLGYVSPARWAFGGKICLFSEAGGLAV